MTPAEVKLALQAPFEDKDIEWRAQRSGIKDGKGWAVLLAYVNNRAIQERLDEAVGIDKWRNEFEKAPDGGVMCGISILFTDWVTKWDGAENTHVEAVKGGLSASMKRAGSQWGIGRYLYNLEAKIVYLNDQKKSDSDLMITVKEDGQKYPKRMFCARPKLPDWALPSSNDLGSLHKIRSLAKQLNHPESVTETRIKNTTTIHDAQLVIDDLEARKAKA